VLHDQDIMNVKVFLRTYNDVIDCAQMIAKRESQRDHYKSYINTLIKSVKDDKVCDPHNIRTIFFLAND